IIHIAEEAYASSLPSPTPINPPQEQPDYPPATPQIQPLSLDPLTMTENDVKILLDLSRRRTELDKQEQKLQEKEQFLKALQDQLTAKIDELMSLKKSVETLVKTFDNRNKESAEKLARYYEGMKPKEAAKILEQLELSILLPVIQHMNQRKVPPILASMDVAKVKEITTKIAETQNLLESKKP
ncbi:MAG: hypothetical protein HYS39_03000, partial [Proteobacteria bacterium]|nr:hypothetical protein [Pseudomonadota bacterium]